jgi:hypothetical protein
MNEKVKSIIAAPTWDDIEIWRRRCGWALLAGFAAGVILSAIVYALGRTIG